MEVILLQDIPGIGKKDDLLLVGDGYALNNLLPHRKALVATPTVRRRYAEQIRRRAEEKQREKEMQVAQASALSGKKLLFERKVTKTGKLYAAIAEKHIADAMKAQQGIVIEPSAVTIPEPIKAVGSFSVTVRIGESAEQVAVTVEAVKVA